MSCGESREISHPERDSEAICNDNRVINVGHVCVSLVEAECVGSGSCMSDVPGSTKVMS